MAKKKGTITCNGYKLIVDNSEESFVFELNVQGDDGKSYHLRVKKVNDRTALVQKTLRKLADLWPAFDFQFVAGSSREITDVF